MYPCPTCSGTGHRHPEAPIWDTPCLRCSGSGKVYPVGPTIGATYATTRGTFQVRESRPQTHGLVVRRSDGRDALVSVSDWQTWTPTVVADSQEDTQDVVDDLKAPTEGKDTL